MPRGAASSIVVPLCSAAEEPPETPCPTHKTTQASGAGAPLHHPGRGMKLTSSYMELIRPRFSISKVAHRSTPTGPPRFQHCHISTTPPPIRHRHTFLLKANPLLYRLMALTQPTPLPIPPFPALWLAAVRLLIMHMSNKKLRVHM